MRERARRLKRGLGGFLSRFHQVLQDANFLFLYKSWAVTYSLFFHSIDIALISLVVIGSIRNIYTIIITLQYYDDEVIVVLVLVDNVLLPKRQREHARATRYTRL